DSRKIHDAIVTVGDPAKINGATDWYSMYIVSKKEFELKDIDIDKKKDVIKLKLQATDQKVGTELNLVFRSADLDAFLFLFTKPGEDMDRYASELRSRIIKTQVESKFDTNGITEDQKVQFIQDVEKLAQIGGKIELDARDDGAYLKLPYHHFTSYNTVR